ncbi:uncharacterized protein N7458_001287 [Penicillium daleae]|uniref:Uncharacterized protein n=1 Tax=Penicillium daleae TaxID=63821 RepID=A0AAD6CAK3_9EURO|nr:uncharacterized protein N7458_001287 [Penicillium daleae]KAJ5459735.1 hypothetical protein N7458_001287 [Penicillium daleae]
MIVRGYSGFTALQGNSKVESTSKICIAVGYHKTPSMSGSSQDYLAAHMYLKDPISISTNVKGVMSMLKGPICTAGEEDE